MAARRRGHLDERRGVAPGPPISPKLAGSRGQATLTAVRLGEVLAAGRYGELPRGVKPDVLLPHLLLDSCTAASDQGIWIHALLAQAETTVPYLSSTQLVPIWQRMRASPCFKRLDARPIATLSLEAQERHERRERVHRED